MNRRAGQNHPTTALLTTARGRWWILPRWPALRPRPGAIWTQQSEDLNVNLLVFASGEGVAEHVNAEVDVLLVGIAGTGAVTIDGTRQILSAGHAIVIPKGARPEHPEDE